LKRAYERAQSMAKEGVVRARLKMTRNAHMNWL